MSDTQLLYLEDSYQRDFTARVVEVRDHSVVLDRTLFYPRGGGQMCDRGTIESFGRVHSVIHVEKRGSTVYHTVEGTPPASGDEIRGTIDWDFRYTMMQTHTALHVLCGVAYHRFAARVTGCHMYPEKARMDFSLLDLTSQRVEELERLTNEAIAAGYPVRSRWIPRGEADLMPELIRTKVNLVPPSIDPIRVVEIVGLDLQADGGTHVANTLEIQSIVISGTENKGRENRRLEIELRPRVIP